MSRSEAELEDIGGLPGRPTDETIADLISIDRDSAGYQSIARRMEQLRLDERDAQILIRQIHLY